MLGEVFQSHSDSDSAQVVRRKSSSNQTAERTGSSRRCSTTYRAKRVTPSQDGKARTSFVVIVLGVIVLDPLVGWPIQSERPQHLATRRRLSVTESPKPSPPA